MTPRELSPGTVVMVPVGQVNALVNGAPCIIAWAVVRDPADADQELDGGLASRYWLDVYTAPGVWLPQMYRPDEILGVPALGLRMDDAAPGT